MLIKSWFSQCWQWKIGRRIAFVGTLLVGISQSSLAQIVPDNTLGSESSTVAPDVNIRGVISDRIEGGAIRGANLFHSFSQFNIGSGRGAYFANPAGIQNILSRVTGSNRSEILGRLGVLGDANLFLINPNGIIFGQNSSLDVRGSFLATTANAVRLGDSGLFSASQPSESNLLSISPSAFWFNAVAAQPIVNRSQAPSLMDQPNSAGLDPGLQVQTGRTLALVGGEVLLEGGRLTAAQGRIELGSVARVGQVSLTQSRNGFVLGYDSISNFGNIGLFNRAFVDASGAGGGDIQIRGARLDVAQGSNIWADTFGTQNGGALLIRTAETFLSGDSVISADVTATGTGGNLTIDTGRLSLQDGGQISVSTSADGNSGSLEITADVIELIDPPISQKSTGLLIQTAGSGNAGDLRIDTGRLLMRDGALIVLGTGGAGKGGRLQITAAESIEILGGSRLNAQSLGSGDAQDATISTRRLSVRDGSQVSVSTFRGGKGGRLQINATELIELSGATASRQTVSGLFAQSEARGNGDAGDLTINTGRLILQGGAQVSVGTRGAGKGGNLQINATDSVEVIGRSADERFSSSLLAQSDGIGEAGNLRINTGRLIVRDGARVSVGTFGAGKGGNLEIKAESVELIGRPGDSQRISGLLAESASSGNAGNLTINAARLLVRDRANISSRSTGTGTAGDIDIITRDTLQANNGRIRTDSTQSRGGAINVRAGKVRLFDNSDITTNVNSGVENGGNIVLKAGSILAFGDSDILAFSQDGRGGNITLDTRAFFSENYRPAPPGTNLLTLNNNDRVDINATGVVSGIITIPDVSFIQNSLTELPDTQINTDTLLATSCIVRRNQPTQGSFTITGTGGLPQRPREAQASSFPTVEIETLPEREPTSYRVWQKGDAIVEPQGVYRLPNGKLVLSRNCL
ncbi:two-partner secretion domain-containing protein [Phormidesmis sp. 146-33]